MTRIDKSKSKSLPKSRKSTRNLFSRSKKDQQKTSTGESVSKSLPKSRKGTPSQLSPDKKDQQKTSVDYIDTNNVVFFDQQDHLTGQINSISATGDKIVINIP